ncbi:DUF1990 domain-containing protein [Falsarthrobacter nasiphocae]|uniref:Uncharacterized protein (UPF0548 family) n=1 Tax=Falsarthrobacter nasiphocae TaxID=189863 RepID=A0AAE3YGS2_9MICC|nr:DUF1990 domain-containing protein [Falsarthrobacter nasiphocae]MDR6891511.1 uncharacterized protein (UPF0548 family) [Falsarthrobacter nasiphocae]
MMTTTQPPWDTLEESRYAGRGQERFERVARALLEWRLHEAAGVRVRPGPDGEAVLRFRLFPVPAPVRILESVGLGASVARLVYEALPGHPEEGRESFTVRLDEDGAVWFDIAARSRPARWYSRWGRPAARAVQLLITRRYLRAATRV